MAKWKSTLKRAPLVVIGIPCAFAAVLAMVVVVAAVFINPRVQAEQDLALSSLLSGPPPPLAAPMTLKVVTYNIADAYLFTGNRPERMRAIAAKLTELDPDIAGIQESFIAADRKLLLECLAGSRLKHHVTFPAATVGNGLLILSAFPIQEAFFHRYKNSNPWYKLWQGDWWAGKGVGLARLQLPDGAVLDFYNTHAQAGRGDPANAAARISQMREMAEFINKSRLPGGPGFLVGDMNTRKGREDLEFAVEHAGLAWAMTVEPGIDHIFTLGSPRYSYETLETVTITGSTQGSRPEFMVSRAPTPREMWDNWFGAPGTTRISDHPGFMSTIQVVPGQP